MTCRQCKKFINDYLDGDLRKARDIEMHIAGCSKCASYYRQMRALYQGLDSGEKPLPAGFHASWTSKIRQKSNSKRKFQYKILIPALAGALCCVFIITAFATGGFTIYSQNNVMMDKNTESGAAEIQQEAMPEEAAEGTEAPLPADSEPTMESELTEGTTDSTTAESSSEDQKDGGSAGAGSAEAQPRAFSGYALPTEGEQISADGINKQEFLKKADEMSISYQLDGDSVLLMEDGSGRIDDLLREFGLSREDSAADVAVIFS